MHDDDTAPYPGRADVRRLLVPPMPRTRGPAEEFAWAGQGLTCAMRMIALSEAVASIPDGQR